VVKTKSQDIGIKTRGIKIKDVSPGNVQQSVDFSEGTLVIETKK